MKKTRVLIIDGQGGRVGRQIIERIREEKIDCVLTAVGTNSTATAAMLKGGADKGATGENAVVVNAPKADIIVGPIGIVITDALLGEITEKMAAAVGKSDAYKLLIPINQCNNLVVGVPNLTLSVLLDSTIRQFQLLLEEVFSEK